MKRRYTFQTFIMLTVAPVLIAFTAVWAWHVYSSAHRIILEGFDRKLLGVAGGTAALVDGDAHAKYQQPREITALAQAGAFTLVGGDASRGELVTIDARNGAAKPLGATRGLRVRSLAAVGTEPRLFALEADGAKIVELDSGGRPLRSVFVAGGLDGVFGASGELMGWRGLDVVRVDFTAGTVAHVLRLPEAMLSVTVALDGTTWYALATDHTTLVVLAPGETVRRVALHSVAEAAAGAETARTEPVRLAPPRLHALSQLGGKLHAAGTTLATIDTETGRVAREGFAPGFFATDDPFYRGYREAFCDLQKRAGLSYLYTQVQTGGKDISYVLDGTVGPRYSPPGTTDELPPAAQEPAEIVQRIGRPWISPIQQWQTWGLLKSCFAPLRGASGEVVAMVGADVEIGIIRRKTRWAAFAAVLVGVCSLIAAGVVSLRVAHALTRPLQQLKEAALGLAAGYYGTRVEVSGSQEISALGGTLDRLRVRLEQERTRSREWLNELRRQRERTSLAQAMHEEAERNGALRDAGGAMGACRCGEWRIWWLGPDEPDPAAAACVRARRTALVRALLAANMPPAELLTRLLASGPGLHGVAGRQAATRVLHYSVREPLAVLSGPVRIDLRGAGKLTLGHDELRWPASVRAASRGGAKMEATAR